MRVRNDTRSLINRQCQLLCAGLLKKNRTYGDSAIHPQRVFSKADPLEQIAVRLDDKISRLVNMGGLVKVMEERAQDGEDVVQDMLGYLVLAQVAAKVHQTGTTLTGMTVGELALKKGMSQWDVFDILESGTAEDKARLLDHV